MFEDDLPFLVPWRVTPTSAAGRFQQVMAWSLSNSEMAEVREAFMELDADKSLAWRDGCWNPWGKAGKACFFLKRNNVGLSVSIFFWLIWMLLVVDFSRLHGEMLVRWTFVFYWLPIGASFFCMICLIAEMVFFGSRKDSWCSSENHSGRGWVPGNWPYIYWIYSGVIELPIFWGSNSTKVYIV